MNTIQMSDMILTGMADLDSVTVKIFVRVESDT